VHISIITVFPDLYSPFLKTSLVSRAQDKGIVSIALDSFFNYVSPKERIDAPTFGHGAGMLIKPTVVQQAVEHNQQQKGAAYKIFFSPHGKKLDQPSLARIAKKSQEKGHLMLVCGRYEGMDARVEETYADEIISLGDFVLMGGDIPAMALLEGCMRLLPGVVGKSESVEHESFSGPWVDYPEYTEPVVWQGKAVPEVIRSGNHKAMQEWRTAQAAKRTVLHHFDWLRSQDLKSPEKKIAKEYIPNHYVALMHTDVLVQDNIPGTTSVTSLDIHDIARSAHSYGIKNYFIVTPLQDQQKIVATLLDFWQKGYGVEYNPSRHEAVKNVNLVSDFQTVIENIKALEGQEPIIIATSARIAGNTKLISYYDQELIWTQQKPVLLLLGTGKGLAPQLLDRADYLLLPIEGFTDFNHLSVRSAAAVILDRWLGINIKVAAD
jgi:tRNA (guanine37-N1)-methyltransferase